MSITTRPSHAPTSEAEPAFFCKHCGYTDAADLTRCPHCGRKKRGGLLGWLFGR